MQKLSNIVFLSYYPEDSPVPLTPPPPTLPLYPLRLLEADAVISRAFNSLSHPLASPFFQKLSPSTFFFPDAIPAVPDTCWEAQPVMSNLGRKKEEPSHGSEWWKEGEFIWMKDWGVPLAIRLFFYFFFPSVSKADFIDFFLTWNTATVEPFHRPIDWNWLPWGPLVL